MPDADWDFDGFFAWSAVVVAWAIGLSTLIPH